MSRNDRRNAHRYAPAKDNIRLGWWQGQLFCTSSARLRNLSLSGALVELEAGAVEPAGAKTWLCLVEQTGAHWVEAEVVEVCSEQPDTSSMLRLKFLDPFPYELFKAAVWDHASRPVEPALPVADARPPTCGEVNLASAQSRVAAIRAQYSRSPLQITAPPARPSARECEMADLTIPHPPTLQEAYRSQRMSSRKVASLSWLIVLVIGLSVSIALGFLARGHLLKLGSLGSYWGGPHRTEPG